MNKRYNKNIFKNLIWIVHNMKIIDNKYIFISIVSTIINGIISPVSLIIMQKIINGVQTERNLNNIIFYIIIYISIDLFNSVYSNFLGYYNTKYSMKFNLYFSEKIYLKASRLSLSDYENSKTYDIMNRAQNQGGDNLLSYYENFMSIITQLITLSSYIFILINFRVWLVAVIMVIPIFKYIINNKFNLKRFEIIKQRTNDSRKSWYLTYLLSYGNFYKELKTYNLFSYFINKYKNLIKRFNKEDLEINKSQIKWSILLSVVETLVDGFIFYYTISLGFLGNILIGDVITYIRAISNSKSNITSILLELSNMVNQSLFIGQLFEFFDLEEEDISNKIKINEIREIEVKNLYYKYNSSKEYVLKNINLHINKNEKIAILGMNGSGKTTLIKLIMGFYRNYEGNILINGIEVRDIDKESLLKEISTLFQDFVKYEASFRENITYSNLKVMNEDEKIKNIANKFNFLNLINSYDKKLDTQLGMWFDEGINLSMGQWQKVALARAFAKESSLYILDEPNASMDSITEREISSLYKDILENKIGIIIAHKFLNIVGFVDEIIILQDGKIIERGNHESLLREGKFYKKLLGI
ncbi:MAG: ABC transporter ATP-binding protein [Peptoniphilus rhinitidis]|uniref:ABC transporter ATP-binding protein n=1 Tax=Peptoniphilus rhinitidis TaxID=1175452 RepID=UPI002914B8DD|nr:ABC transporter ATP-binding protein [Peptoniphilus rhinitidis]MDU3751559.1 ABC transporter ATP-binding protein [Peptoniphilus rhinitidis]